MKYSFLTSWRWNFCCIQSHNDCNIKQEGESVWKKPVLPGNSQITTSKVNCKMTVTFNVAITVLPNGLLLTQSQRFLSFSQLVCKLLRETSWSALFFLSSEVLAAEGTHPKCSSQTLGGNASPPEPGPPALSWDHNRKGNALSSFLPWNRTLTLFEVAMWLLKNIPPQTPWQWNWPCDPKRSKPKSAGRGSQDSFVFPHEKGLN